MGFKPTDRVGPFQLKSANGLPDSGNRLVILLDKTLIAEEEKLLENFLRFSSEVIIVSPMVSSRFELSTETVDALSSLGGTCFHLICTGAFAPLIIEQYEKFRNAGKVVFINPTYRKDIAVRMSSFESPSLVVTATPGNLDHDPDAVKYHDLISGSEIKYVRGVTGNPLYEKFTQSFNSIHTFLTDD